ncbi:MAG: hypothetical protein KDB53_10250 [Planctomycetes bacterium]|nr:hypothetical protein [Planctomycetota bacterium]
MDSCPPVKDIVDAVEAVDMPLDLHEHIEACGACSGILATLRDETEGLTICVGSLWVRERITCPHSDILLSWVNGVLDPAESDYIAFHLETVDCPHCQAEVARLQAVVEQDSTKRVQQARDDSLRRSAVFIDGLRRSR